MSNAPCSAILDLINGQANVEPAISYDYDSDGLIIGWDCSYSPGSLAPTQSIVIRCTMTGAIDNSCPYTNFLTVSLINAADAARQLSISGRDYYYNSTDYMMYTTWTTYNAPAALQYKDVPWTNCTLRVSKAINKEHDEFVAYPNPFTEQVTLNNLSGPATVILFDLTGNTLLQLTGTKQEINLKLNQITFLLPKGIYFIRIEAEDLIENKKLVKM